MGYTAQDAQAEIASWQTPEKDEAPHPMVTPDAPPNPIQSAMTPPPAGVPKPSFLDSVISTVDNYTSKLSEHIGNDPAVRMLRQAQAGAIKGVVNTVDAAKSGVESLPDSPEPGNIGPDLFHPAYDAARTAVLNFRDSIAVKDPSIPENLAEGAGQLMPSFLMFSRVLGALGNTAELAGGVKKAIDFAKFATADAATNATAIAPHDPRLSDTVSLLQHSEGKFADLLNQVTPDGVRSYIDYLADHKNEGEAEGRWKNVVDGWGAAAALTGVLHTAGGIFKQGWNVLHYMADNNMGSMSDMLPPNQEGHIGYHGSSTAGIEQFNSTAMRRSLFGHGLYVPDDVNVAKEYAKGPGTLYKVEIPDEHVASMIDWDKRIDQQPTAVKKILLDKKLAGPSDTGADLMNALGTTPETSAMLNKLGIKGVRYPASGKYSQGGSDSRISVLFDPGEARITGTQGK